MAHIIQTITSLKNPKVQFWKNLYKHPFRTREGQFLVEGAKMVDEALASGWKVAALMVDEEKQEALLPLVLSKVSAETQVYLLSSHVFKGISAAKSPQGISAALYMPKAPSLGELGSFIIALDQVQDPGNVGTIIRTADAGGFTGILLSHHCADVFSDKVLRSTMGSIFHLPMAVTKNLPDTLVQLQQKGVHIVGSQLGAQDFFFRSPIPPPLTLVVGNEGNGISKEVLNLCDYRYALPMEGRAESLNVAIAAGIMMYDLVRNENS